MNELFFLNATLSNNLRKKRENFLGGISQEQSKAKQSKPMQLG
jgi:hypothetical protein